MPATYYQNDTENRVADQVFYLLGATGRFDLHDLDVTASHGIVTLHGHVSSYYHKQMAQAVALRVEGVQDLENCLEVA